MRRNTKTVVEQHHDWLTQVETDGPFLALPVVKDIWPQGVERLGDADDRMVIYKQAYVQWQRAFDTFSGSPRTEESRAKYDAINSAWIELVLDQLAGWQDLRISRDDPRVAGMSVVSPGGEVVVRSSGALEGRGNGIGALLLVVSPTIDLRANGLDGWAATEVDRLAMLLRKAGVEVGIVTDGQWWAVVWAKAGKPTGSGMVNALTWAEEPLLRDAFLTLIDQRRFRAKDAEQQLTRLLERSELEAEVITEALGTQVRKSVELLVQAFSEARLAAARRDEPDPLTPKPDDVYQAAVTIMMRVVFFLFAEERGMLPTEQLYWDSYAIRDLLDDLAQKAADGEEHLEETFDAWHRLLAVSQALFFGVNFDEMRMPAYGGSLLDPARFPWLYATDGRGLRLKVSDRVMLHVLDSVQAVEVKKERRRISFRDIDVEQIGYIYEGLLGYSCAVVADEVVLGLVGKDGEEPEIDAASLQGLYDHTADSKSFASALVDWTKEHQPAATGLSLSRLAKMYDLAVSDAQHAEMRRLLAPVAAGDEELLGFLIDWSYFIRKDLRGIPLVVPVGGLVVVETPSRKNAGAHYTPRSLAEEVVKYALEPLVYEPGPLQTNNGNAWKLKSSTAILDLKIADIAAGSGAFLVAAGRFLASRVTEAWTEEGTLSRDELANPKLANDRALREVIARCLYGADINPMAVEMCKLSLWLVSMDWNKPFSFVDDKIFCGNSLLGITSIDELRALHIYPDTRRGPDLLHQLVDVDGKIAEAARLRHELASPVDDLNPMRSTRGKLALLDQAKESTADLRLIADGIIAAGLVLGGRPGSKLDDAYKVLSWELAEALPAGGLQGDRAEIEKHIKLGLAPVVETDYDRWHPVHWLIEAPDVIVGHAGFDAVIGNPPYLSGTKISGAIGGNVREWIAFTLTGRDGGGRADFVAYFFVRAQSLLAHGGGLGLIATNTIAQGDTREVGLDSMVAGGLTLTRAVRSRPWPSRSANLEYAAVWGSVARVDPKVLRVVDDVYVASISTFLEPAGRVSGVPRRLVANSGISFEGCKPYGQGFVLDTQEALAWIHEDSRNAAVLSPYINGDDLNQRPDITASRYIIDFNQRTEIESSQFQIPFARARAVVFPERALKAPAVRDAPWWQFFRTRPNLRKAMNGLTDVLAIARVSKTIMPVRIKTGQIPSEAMVVFASESFVDQAVLSSTMHQLWAIKYGSGMRNDPRYTPSDVFETFPRPVLEGRLGSTGRALDVERREIMLRRRLGLTTLYNHVNDPKVQADRDVSRMRDLHVQIDLATMSAYGWGDLNLDHDFHSFRQMERYTVSPAARVEILDRLLELNFRRAREEGQDVPDQGGLF